MRFVNGTENVYIVEFNIRQTTIKQCLYGGDIGPIHILSSL